MVHAGRGIEEIAQNSRITVPAQSCVFTRRLSLNDYTNQFVYFPSIADSTQTLFWGWAVLVGGMDSMNARMRIKVSKQIFRYSLILWTTCWVRLTRRRRRQLLLQGSRPFAEGIKNGWWCWCLLWSTLSVPLSSWLDHGAEVVVRLIIIFSIICSLHHHERFPLGRATETAGRQSAKTPATPKTRRRREVPWPSSSSGELE